jgi:6-phosphofructokinase 1
LNAVIRAVAKTAMYQYGMETWGIEDGYQGLIEDRIHPLDSRAVSGILTVGGTILGSSNTSNPFCYPITIGKKTANKDVSEQCLVNLAKRGIETLICIGGDGTMNSAAAFAKKGLTVMGVPKTIDNDLFGTDITFGFDTAVNTATEAIDKLHTTASSHHRVMLLDVILIPEIPYDINKVCDYVLGRSKTGRRFSIICVAEGAKAKGGKMVVAKTLKNSPDPIRLGGISFMLADQLAEMTDLSCRAVNLGHVQRGGIPSPFDRRLATQFGHFAMELLMGGKVNRLVVMKGGKLDSIPLGQTAGRIKTVPMNDSLIAAARAVGTSFGI